MLNPPFEVPPRKESCGAQQKFQAGSHPPKCCLCHIPRHPTTSHPSCVRRRSRTGPIHHPNTTLGSLRLGRVTGTMVIRDRAWSVPQEHRVEGAPPKHSSPFPRLLKGLTASPDTCSMNPSRTGWTVQVPGDHKLQQIQEYPPLSCPDKYLPLQKQPNLADCRNISFPFVKCTKHSWLEKHHQVTDWERSHQER